MFKIYSYNLKLFQTLSTHSNSFTTPSPPKIKPETKKQKKKTSKNFVTKLQTRV